MKQKLIVLTGAGISAESGIQTFRGSDGLWEGYNIEDVATPEAWERDPELVQQFYNIRRKAIVEALPNKAHQGLVQLEQKYEVTIITQNIDDLHERAGSSNVLHLHGLITKSQSSINSQLLYPISGWELKMGEFCKFGSQLRPHVVWFGEAVPMMSDAIKLCAQADIFIVIGTSLQVYPAASLMDYVPDKAKKFLIDPETPDLRTRNITVLNEPASRGVGYLVKELLEQ